MEEETLYDRIGEADLNPTYKDGQVYQHTDVNKMLSILKTAVNENYHDIQKLENGEKEVGNAKKLNNAALSRYLDETLQSDDNKVPTSQQAKAYVDNLFAEYSPPIRGVDYWTEEDKEEIIDETIEESQLKPKGDYDPTVEYKKLDIVLYQNSSYVALQTTQGNLPTDTDYWQILVSGELSSEDIVDNLESNYSDKVLSAKQGKVLNEGKLQVFNTVANMKADTSLKAGMTVKTKGYYETNDGGHAEYIIVDDDTLVDDGGLVHSLVNGLYAILIIENNTINVKQFGAKGDGETDDTQIIQTAIDNLNDYQTLYIPKGNFKITPQDSYSILNYGSYTANYGVYINNKNNINIKCEGIIICDMSTDIMNTFAVQSCNNVKIEGLEGYYEGETITTNEVTQRKSLLHINNCNDVNVKNIKSTNTGHCCILVKCNNSFIKDSKGTRTTLQQYSGAIFGCYESKNILFDNCITYGACNDGDLSLFAHCEKVNVQNCKLYASFESDPTEITGTGFQGICVDSSCLDCNISNNYVYGYYYGIDVKTNTDSIIVSKNICEKNKYGIAVRMGEGNSPTTNTIVESNIINTDGGNGNEVVIVDGFTSCGIYTQNAYGVKINGNILSNKYNVGDKDFINVYCSYNHTSVVGYAGITEITNNLFNNYGYIGSSSQRNKGYSIYLKGSASVKFPKILISNNSFKNLVTTSQDGTKDVIYGEYIEDIEILNNIFSKYGAKSYINLNNTTDISIKNNHFEQTRNTINLVSCDYYNIHNNYIKAHTELMPTVNLDSCTYGSFKNNYYKATTNEGNICVAKDCNYLVSAFNTLITSKATSIANYSSTSTNLTDDSSNIYWNS